MPSASSSAMWDDPHRNTWVNQLNLAIHKAGRPVILVAHSLACHVVAWWNEYERPGPDGPVLGALLVAPPEVEKRRHRSAPRALRAGDAHARCRSPRSSPRAATIHWIGFDRARRLARIWKSRFVDAGWLGHINADSGIRDWPFGQFLLRQLARRDRAAQPAADPRAELRDAARAAGGAAAGSPNPLPLTGGMRPLAPSGW